MSQVKRVKTRRLNTTTLCLFTVKENFPEGATARQVYNFLVESGYESLSIDGVRTSLRVLSGKHSQFSHRNELTVQNIGLANLPGRAIDLYKFNPDGVMRVTSMKKNSSKTPRINSKQVKKFVLDVTRLDINTRFN